MIAPASRWLLAVALLLGDRGVRFRRPTVLVLVPAVRDSMNAIFVRSNAHWNELADVNTLTQMLGTGKATQLEYMGCLHGEVAGDTVWVTGTEPARDMKRFQFAVTGTCDHAVGGVGTWHTHPYKADVEGRPTKERVLSAGDLTTFAQGPDRAVIAVWDTDSLDAAVRGPSGRVAHPARVVVR